MPALRSTRLSLAPVTTELFDASTAYLWALARDSKGNLYTGGGPGAKLFVIAPNGTHKKLADFDALEIHAIAIDSRDEIHRPFSIVDNPKLIRDCSVLQSLAHQFHVSPRREMDRSALIQHPFRPAMTMNPQTRPERQPTYQNDLKPADCLWL